MVASTVRDTAYARRPTSASTPAAGLGPVHRRLGISLALARRPRASSTSPHAPTMPGDRAAICLRARLGFGGRSRRSQSMSRPIPTSAPARRRLAPSADEHLADHGLDPHRRRFEIVGDRRRAPRPSRRPRRPASGQPVPAAARRWRRPASSPLRRPSAANTSLVATGTRGLTITQGIFGRLSGSSFSPTPVMSQACEARQTGTSAPVSCATSISARIVERQTVQPRQQPQRRRRIRRAAADAGRHRQHLVEGECADLQIRARVRPAAAPP